MTDATAVEGTGVGVGRRGRSLALRLGAAVASVAAMVAVVTTTSRAAFTSSTSNGSQTMTAGTVTVADDDADSLMFNLNDIKPGVTYTKCINVTYTGTLTADVKLWGTVGGTGLATYLDTVIDVGTGAAGGSSFDCTGFVEPGTNLHTGTLAAFGTSRTNYSNGLGGFTGATNSTTKSYRISQTVQSNNSAQGKTAMVTFTWESQNT